MQHLVQIRHHFSYVFLSGNRDPELFFGMSATENFLAEIALVGFCFIILRGFRNTASDEDTRIGLHHRCVFRNRARESYDDFIPPTRSSRVKTRHCLVILVYLILSGDNAADNLAVGDGWETRLLIRLEVCRAIGVLPPALLLLERMIMTRRCRAPERQRSLFRILRHHPVGYTVRFIRSRQSTSHRFPSTKSNCCTIRPLAAYLGCEGNARCLLFFGLHLFYP